MAEAIIRSRLEIIPPKPWGLITEYYTKEPYASERLPIKTMGQVYKAIDDLSYNKTDKFKVDWELVKSQCRVRRITEIIEFDLSVDAIETLTFKKGTKIKTL